MRHGHDASLLEIVVQPHAQSGRMSVTPLRHTVMVPHPELSDRVHELVYM
ncbi:MAG: hypothetical protein KIT68_08780 [Phycisphaeraceae bacterium]|nr:hypothetical protein [Phycisphaeraceae bacterium]